MKKYKWFTVLLALVLAVPAWAMLAGSAAHGQDAALNEEDGNSAYDSGTAVQVSLDQQQGGYVISAGGTYVLSGTLNGMLTVQAGENDLVRLVLNNAVLANDSGPAIYARKADKVILTLAEGSSNEVRDGAGYEPDEDGANAAVYAKTDLTINGSGSLRIIAQTAHGVLSRDRLAIAGGTIAVTSVKDGLRGKDSVVIADGSLDITAGSDGIVSTGTQQGTGVVTILGGDIRIRAQRDGIQAETDLSILGGTFDILTGDGATAGEVAANLPAEPPADAISGATRGQGTGQQPTVPQQDGRRQPMPPQDGSRPPRAGGWQQPAATNSTEESRKALKAGSSLRIAGGQFTINAQDDALHTNGDAVVSDGIFRIQTGDDGVHADGALLVQGGDLLITACYEGLEAKTVTIDGGRIDITATDDGINAASGSAQTGMGMRGGMSPEAGVSVTINGGNVKVVAGFDGIDSNGTAAIHGGVVSLTSQRSGSGGTFAIDTNGGYTYTAGQVTTNDGSENSAGMQQGRPARGR